MRCTPVLGCRRQCAVISPKEQGTEQPLRQASHRRCLHRPAVAVFMTNQHSNAPLCPLQFVAIDPENPYSFKNTKSNTFVQKPARSSSISPFCLSWRLPLRFAVRHYAFPLAAQNSWHWHQVISMVNITTSSDCSNTAASPQRQTTSSLATM